MLEFLLNDEALMLDATASVRLTWRNPAFNIEDFPGDLGLGIDIPVNDHNRMLLLHPDRFERRAGAKVKEFDRFEIRYGGVLLMRGTFIVQNASNQKYSGWLRSNLGTLGKYHREKYVFESISFNEEKLFSNKANYDPLTDDYACPQILNPDFFKEKGEKVKLTRWVTNPDYGESKWWQDLFAGKREPELIEEEYETEDLTAAFLRTTVNGFVNFPNDDGTVYTPEETQLSDKDTITNDMSITAVSPMLFLNYFLKTVFKDAGFSIRANFIEDNTDLQKLILYNNYDITGISYSTSGEVYEAKWGQYGEYLGLVATGKTITHVTRSVNSPFLYKNLVPQAQVKDLLIGLQNLLNVFFLFDPKRKIVDIIDRESIVTGETVDLSAYLSGFWEMDEQKDSTLKFTFDHDDNDTVFKEQFTDIDEFRDNEKEAVEIFDDLMLIENPEMDEIRYIKSENRYAQYKLWLLETINSDGETEQEKFLGWYHLTIGFQNGYFNRKKEFEEEIKTGFSTLLCLQNSITHQKGNIRSEMFAYENFSPRLLFYLGNNTAKYETENISLDWEKPVTGLLATRWKNWKKVMAQRQPVKTSADLPLNALDYVIRNIYKKFRCDEGVFLIEEMETEFGLNFIGQTKISGYKMNYAPNSISLGDMVSNSDVVSVDQMVVIDESARRWTHR